MARVWVAESIPLKQGLKQMKEVRPRILISVAESIPLKQGLKLPSYMLYCQRYMGCGEHSIKTRIETRIFNILDFDYHRCGEHSIKTRIETCDHPKTDIPYMSCGEHSIKTRIETVTMTR